MSDVGDRQRTQQQIRHEIQNAITQAFKQKHPDGPFVMPIESIKVFDAIIDQAPSNPMLSLTWTHDILSRALDFLAQEKKSPVWGQTEEETERTICVCGKSIYYGINGSAWYHDATNRQPCDWDPVNLKITQPPPHRYATPAYKKCGTCVARDWKGCWRCMPSKWRKPTEEENMIAASCPDGNVEQLEEFIERGYETDAS